MMNIHSILDSQKKKFRIWRATMVCQTDLVRLKNGMMATCLATQGYIIRGRLLITLITNVFPRHSGQEQAAMR